MAVSLIKKPNLNQVSFSKLEGEIPYGLQWGLEASLFSICLFEKEKLVFDKSVNQSESVDALKQDFLTDIGIPQEVKEWFAQCSKYL